MPLSPAGHDGVLVRCPRRLGDRRSNFGSSSRSFPFLLVMQRLKRSRVLFVLPDITIIVSLRSKIVQPKL